MAQTSMVNFRLDEDIKKGMEKVCKELGMSMTTAFTIFATKVCREQGIPFELKVDPFYSESNMRELERRIKDIREGRAHFAEHELIEVDD